MIRASWKRALAQRTTIGYVSPTTSRSFSSRQTLLCSCNSHAVPLDTTTSRLPVPSADHRNLGSSLDLFSTTEFSPGTPLLHADGSHVFLKLQQFLRAQYAMFGFREVISPTIYKESLWQKSGHWENYKDDMFEVTGNAHGVEEANADGAKDHKYGLKPMNCPGHCLLFKSRNRSWRDLPIRYADFSPLHRNEISGALSGLTRVRRFHQDDGHIFCRPDQIRGEIERTLQFVGMVYKCFGLGPYKLVLSTRPAAFIGEQSDWDQAENHLRKALDSSAKSWEMNEGDGAFYGPKIDIVLKDSDGKEHQTATIQLDFQLPSRFELKYADEEGAQAQPVMVHRAIFGSLERFMALLIEHYKGKWPFWLNPRQVAILPLNDQPETLAHAQRVQDELQGFEANATSKQLMPLNTDRLQTMVDSRAVKLGAKKAQARADNHSLIAVVGPKEVENRTLSLDITGLLNAQDVLKKEWLAELGTITNKQAISMKPQQLKHLAKMLCDSFY